MPSSAVNNSASHRQQSETVFLSPAPPDTHTLMTCIFSMFRVAASLVCTRTVNVQPARSKLSSLSSHCLAPRLVPSSLTG